MFNAAFSQFDVSTDCSGFERRSSFTVVYEDKNARSTQIIFNTVTTFTCKDVPISKYQLFPVVAYANKLIVIKIPTQKGCPLSS